MKNWQTSMRHERTPELPFFADVDVLVIGGGAAGVAAATVAAEAGKSVLLVERYGFCGGAAVAGMSGTICGMYLAEETPLEPRQIVYGFTERFHQALRAKAGVTAPQLYGKTFTVTHDPLAWREVADELLESAGVRVLFHTWVSAVVLEGDNYQGAVIESNAGQSLVMARRIIDASGDAAAIAKGGYRYTFGDNGKIQNPTMFFRIGNVDVPRFQDYWGPDTISPLKVSAAIEKANESSNYFLPRKKIWIFPSPRPNELMVNATRLTGRDGRTLNVIDPVDFTEAEIDGRRQVREYARFLTDVIPGCETSFVVDTGVEVGIRQTRTIDGAATLTNADVIECRKRTDSICRSPWPIELHSGNHPKLQWLLNDYYDVPYLALVPRIGENIIVAGRSLSAEHEALASARVTAQCFEYGHAAGTAAVVSLNEQIQFRNIPGEKVAAIMAANGSAL